MSCGRAVEAAATSAAAAVAEGNCDQGGVLCLLEANRADTLVNYRPTRAYGSCTGADARSALPGGVSPVSALRRSLSVSGVLSPRV